MKTIADVLRICERNLEILALNDANFRDALIQGDIDACASIGVAASPEKADFINRQPIEQLRKSLLEGTFGNLDFDLGNLMLEGWSGLPIK